MLKTSEVYSCKEHPWKTTVLKSEFETDLCQKQTHCSESENKWCWNEFNGHIMIFFFPFWETKFYTIFEAI